MEEKDFLWSAGDEEVLVVDSTPNTMDTMSSTAKVNERRIHAAIASSLISVKASFHFKRN